MFQIYLIVFQVSATAGITQMTHEHLALVVALKLPFFIVVTKTDVTPPDQIIKLLEDELKSIGFNKVCFINSIENSLSGNVYIIII